MINLILAGLVSISISPTACFAPCKLVVTLKVEPQRDNEKVVLEIEGELYSRSTDMNYDPYCYEKDGKELCHYPPKTVTISYPGVPGGEYMIKATLYKHDGKTWIAGADHKMITVTDVNQDR